MMKNSGLFCGLCKLTVKYCSSHKRQRFKTKPVSFLPQKPKTVCVYSSYQSISIANPAQESVTLACPKLVRPISSDFWSLLGITFYSRLVYV